MIKTLQFKIQGMQKDPSPTLDNVYKQKAYDLKNIRLLATDSSTQLDLVNELGNTKQDILGISKISGTPIGQSVICNNYILFTVGESREVDDFDFTETSIEDLPDLMNDIQDFIVGNDDHIYKMWYKNNLLYGKELFKGDLNLSVKHPLETIPIYENESIQKIYWLDGINQTRVINIALPYSERTRKWSSDSFNFVRKLNLLETFTIEKQLNSGGSFNAGVIQYCFTYYDKYMQESNIVMVSPLYYIAFKDRGASPEETVSNSFKITIDNLDHNYDYVRIYSIHRTTTNGEPTCKKLIDLSFNSSVTKLSFIDNGSTGETILPTDLLTVGGEDAVLGTFQQKDNTLFLGNLFLNRKSVPKAIKEQLGGNAIIGCIYSSDLVRAKSITLADPTSFYNYNIQLNKSANDLKIFKYLETYRLGIQFQHYTGKWSEPIFLNDVKNTLKPTGYYHKKTTVSFGQFVYDVPPSVIVEMASYGYVKIRPVIVYPDNNNKSILCQGFVNPTLFNVGNRNNNAPFVQSSWFARPDSPYDDKYSCVESTRDCQDRDLGTSNSVNSMSGILNWNGSGTYGKDIYGHVTSSSWLVKKDWVEKGACITSRHLRPIGGFSSRNGEVRNLQSTRGQLQHIVKSNVETYKRDYYVDKSIVTFHSPELEFDDITKSMDMSNTKFRILGIVPLTSFTSDINIITKDAPCLYVDRSFTAPGFYKNKIEALGISRFGFRAAAAGIYWYDMISAEQNWLKNDMIGAEQHWRDNGGIWSPFNNDSPFMAAFFGWTVYPWNTNGRLSNIGTEDPAYEHSNLKNKMMSNLRFSYNNFYFNDNEILDIPNSGPVIYDSTEATVVKVKSPNNSNMPDIMYQGNIDTITTTNRSNGTFSLYTAQTNDTGGFMFPTPFPVKAEWYDRWFYYTALNANDGITSQTKNENTFTNQVCQIQYKTSPHAVIAFDYNNTYGIRQTVLPTFRYKDRNNSYVEVNDESSSGGYFYYNPQCQGVDQTAITHDFTRAETGVASNVLPTGPEFGILWLGEVYRDLDPTTLYGGKSEEAIENNLWQVGGASMDIRTAALSKQSVKVVWSYGDTFYQRYDNLMTYARNEEDINQNVEIVSFMVETKINLDGRYDSNRGKKSNLTASPNNFNKINMVYSQSDNFFTYRSINPNRVNIDKFSNVVTWTKPKTYGELIDSWTNINIGNTLDLDGDKGEVRALRRCKNELYAFQDKGICRILFNNRTQLSTTEGTPIELATSGTVDGKVYETTYGCINKWSISPETPLGLYFIDDSLKSIVKFDGKWTNLSDTNGFHSYMKTHSNTLNIWNPSDFNTFVTYYDAINKDVFFINSTDCLAYSETLQSFSSFYSYNHVPYMTNIDNRFISVNPSRHLNSSTEYFIWNQNEGNYNVFYNKYEPYHVQLLATDTVVKDRIFNTVEIMADGLQTSGAYIPDLMFDSITVNNEFQSNTETLQRLVSKPCNLQKKFRLWRINIPRDFNSMDRMRNPWLYVKLEKTNESFDKLVVHDFKISYYE